jgi:uncharacterized protein YkwD
LSKHRAPRPRSRPQVEQLESRLTPSTAAPTKYEQLLLEALNDARADPAAYGKSIGIDLSHVAPSQPLAWNGTLIAGAHEHNDDMSDRAFFGHTNPDGEGVGDRMKEEGFNWTSFGESIAAGQANYAAALKALVIDKGIPDLGHRRHLLATDAVFKNQNQVGIGVRYASGGPYVNYYTIDTAASSDARPFLCGVVYKDANKNGRYDFNEGLSGVTVSVQSGSKTTTYVTGGYSLRLDPGSYTVTFKGGGLAAPITKKVAISSTNHRCNAIAPATASTPPKTPTTPAPTTSSQPNYSAWVTQLGKDLYRRTLTKAEVDSWVGKMKKGTTRESVVNSFVASAEYQRVQLGDWVGRTAKSLGVTLTSAEKSSWVAHLERGGGEDAVVAALMSKGGHDAGASSAWFDALSRGLLGRTLGGAEREGWVSFLNAGGSKNVVIVIFLGGSEYRELDASAWVKQTASDVLGKSLSTSQHNAWVDYLTAGGSQATVVTSLVNAADYTHKYLNV